MPLTDCSVRASNGQYAVIRRDVSLALACRNAIEFRLAESTDFGAAPFAPMTAGTTFTLSVGAGTKPVYAQFRGAQGTDSNSLDAAAVHLFAHQSSRGLAGAARRGGVDHKH